MNKKIKDYLKFFWSLVIMGFGVSLVTKSNLGTSAGSSVAFVLSNIFPLTFGTFTFLIYLIYFTAQILVLKREFPVEQYFQLLVGPTLGIFIDLAMYIFTNLYPVNYLMQLLFIIVGCFIIAYSITLQLEANVVVNPTEGLTMLIADRSGIEFSTVKTVFDSTLVVLSIIASLIGLGKIIGVREGTLISAFLVGTFIKIIKKIRK